MFEAIAYARTIKILGYTPLATVVRRRHSSIFCLLREVCLGRVCKHSCCVGPTCPSEPHWAVCV